MSVSSLLARATSAALFFTLALPAHAQVFVRVTDSPVTSEARSSGGAVWFDADGDGDLDLFVANGNVEDQTNSLFLNDGAGGFAAATDAGALLTDSAPSIGGTAGDFDGDGDPDLFVTNRGRGANNPTPTLNLLYRNDGGSFTRVTDGLVGTDAADSNSSSWVDIDGDGDLDLFVTNFDAANFLYRNDGGDLTRTEADPITIVVSSSINGSWADADNDGDFDYFMGNGNTGDADDKFYRNDGDLAFATTSFADGVSTLGSSWGDFDADGDLDLFTAHFLNADNALYLNAGSPDFTLAPTKRVPITTDGGLSTGSSWGDVDNDGDLDLFVSNFNQDNALYLNDGSPSYTFTEVTDESVVSDGGASFGNALADYDEDGDLDLFVANVNGQANFLYENQTDAGAWLQFDLVGMAPNTTALGARVYVQAMIGGVERTQFRVAEAQSGYNSQTTRLHVGLGDATTADLRVVWPSGEATIQLDVPVNQTLRIVEGKDTASEAIGDVSETRLAAYPNPVIEEAIVAYALDRPGHVRLVIHDLLGRPVRVLVDAYRSSGPHREGWDGRDESGRTAAVGTYLVTLIQNGETQSRVLTRLR